MPCQEPPVAMSTWQASIHVPEGCVVLMSGNQFVGKTNGSDNQGKPQSPLVWRRLLDNNDLVYKAIFNYFRKIESRLWPIIQDSDMSVDRSKIEANSMASLH